MIWLVLILVHGVLCVAALGDLASLWMSPRARAAWFIAVLLLPLGGVALYVLLGRRRYDAEGRPWPDPGGINDAAGAPVGRPLGGDGPRRQAGDRQP